MYRFKINELMLNSIQGEIPLKPKKVNVFIGPNNSVYTSIPAQNVVLKGTEVVLGCKNTQLDLLGNNITYPALDTLRIGFNATISSSTPFLDINPSILSYPANLEPSLQPTNR